MNIQNYTKNGLKIIKKTLIYLKQQYIQLLLPYYCKKYKKYNIT